MRYEDLHDVEIGDILKCKDLDAVFKVVDIDFTAKHTPIQVELLSSNSTELVSGALYNDEFDKSNEQWLYLSTAVFRDIVPNFEKFIDVEDLITLDRLEPLADVSSPEYENLKELAEPEESEEFEEFEAITANQAAELSKRKILRELMDRIRKAISSDFGVFELKVPDLDLDPVTSDLEWLGYTVRFSMQDDEFIVSWEPKL